jgi:hypothetical protein
MSNGKIGKRKSAWTKLDVNFTISYAKNQIYIPNHPKSI